MLFIPSNVAYISNFLLNLVFLGCLQKRGFDWSHCLVKISKNNQIFDYTRFYGNNYEIGNDESDQIAFATLAADLATLKNTWPYQGPYSTATSNTLHCKIGHISSLGLYMLGKKYLQVQLQGKKMSQCIYCAMSKISQEVSHGPPANQSTQPFHKVYIDWLDLKNGWDSYQGNKAIVRQVMVAICEATRMAVTYFI